MDLKIKRVGAVNAEALDGELRGAAVGATGLEIGGDGLVTVHMPDGADKEAVLLAYQVVEQHDAGKLTAEQARRLAQRQALDQARKALAADPEDRELELRWLMLEVTRLIQLMPD